MSKSTVKIFLGVFILHYIVIRGIWVGFSAPVPRPPATFTYEGELSAQDIGSGADQVWQKGKTSEQLPVDHFEASYFDHWIKLRDPSNSITYKESST